MILDEYLERYIEEAKVPATKEELKAFSTYAPIMLDGVEVGILGLDIVPSDVLGQVAVIKLIYIKPEFRGNFRGVALSIFQALYDQGIYHVELHTNRKISKWLRRYTKNYPVVYVHWGKVEEMLSKLKEGSNGV